MRSAMYVVIAVMLAVVAGCAMHGKDKAKEKKTNAEEAMASVATQVVRPTDVVERVEVTGTLQPADETTVGSRTPGRIVWLIGKEGTPVKAGQVVARLDDTDARTQVRSATAAVQAAEARLEQAKAAVTQQVTSTDTGIQTADAALQAANARLKQALVTADATEASAKAQIKAAEAGLDSAKSRLVMLRNGSRTQERAIAENAVKLAKATYENDQVNYNRMKSLFEQGAVSRAQVDSAETKMRVAEAQLNSAQEQASLVQVGPREEDIQAAEAAVRQAEEGVATARANLKQVDVARANVDIAETGVAQAKAALASAKSARQVNVMRDKDVLAAQAGVQQAKDLLANALQNLDYANIYSPVHGVVSAKMAEVGESVGANAPVLKISTNSSLYYEARVSELEAMRLRAGQSVTLTVDALQGSRTNLYGESTTRLLKGTVEKVVPVVDARSRSFIVRVITPNSAALFPGMFARGSVEVARHAQVMAVPKDALLEKDGKTFVFVYDGGKARAYTVMPGASDGKVVQVMGDLLQGQEVIVAGQQTLQEGDAVKVANGKTTAE